MDNLESDTTLSEKFRSFLCCCLEPDVSKRSSIQQLIEHEFLTPNFIPNNQVINSKIYIKMMSEIPRVYSSNPLSILSLEQTFQLWKIAFEDTLFQKSSGILSIFRIPIIVEIDRDLEEVLEEAFPDSADLFSDEVVDITMQPLEKLISTFDRTKVIRKVPSFSGLLNENSSQAKINSGENDWKFLSADNIDRESSFESRFTLSSKEKDVGYQYDRILRFFRLLATYPLSRPEIIAEARIDVPPILRGYIWAALLDVRGNTDWSYDQIDFETVTETDRQLDLDIPRCHQYNELLSSPIGRSKLKRCLKAWVLEENKLLYWQGLDSLCAPFVCTNFLDEGLAYASFKAFVAKYSRGFFTKDNSVLIAENMSALQKLLSFHDCELSAHLFNSGLLPDLYAIPWMMTSFARIS